MRILALDGTLKGMSPQVLESALSDGPAPTRIFLFREAIATFEGVAQRAREQMDQQFLADAARWLLSDDPGPSPRRPGREEIARRAVGISAASPPARALLPCTAQAVEIAGPFVVMAAPDASHRRKEIHENAALWILGGTEAPCLEREERSAWLSPGDVQGAGGTLDVRIDSRGAVVARWLQGDKAIREEAFSLGSAPKLEFRSEEG